MEQSDELLMKEMRKGDADMLSPLMRKYEKPLFAFIYRILGSRREAEDLFQETFLRIYQKRNTYREDLPFHPWMYKICLNLCRDHQRERMRKPEKLFSDEQEPERIADPKARMTRNLIVYRVKTAIRNLPEKLRFVFLLHNYQGLSYQEIAGTLAIPVGTVKSRMNLAVAQLAEELRDLEVDVA
jgi:RNA polymerase sigma-70 factor (ECF subfamily)